jgi:aspartate-semialdehyde dehydrogenase
MAHSCAENEHRARVALVGSATACGGVIRQALESFGVPGSRVDLFGTSRGDEPVISEYGGEARLIQTPELDELTASDIVFVCEPGEVVERLVGLAGPRLSIVDAAHALPDSAAATLVHMDVNPGAAEENRGVLAVPHHLSTLLVDLVHPLESAFGCEEVVAFVMRPAADFGEAGVEELRDQTVRLLNFAATSAEVFGRQLAFNVLPQSAVSGLRPERRIAGEVADLLGWDRSRLGLALSVVPVFFGHTVLLRVRTVRATTTEELVEVLERAGLRPAVDEPRISPLDVSSVKGIHVAEVSADGAGGFWLSAVAGEVPVRSAELAVRLADAVRGL